MAESEEDADDVDVANRSNIICWAESGEGAGAAARSARAPRGMCRTVAMGPFGSVGGLRMDCSTRDDVPIPAMTWHAGQCGAFVRTLAGHGSRGRAAAVAA